MPLAREPLIPGAPDGDGDTAGSSPNSFA